MEFQQLLEKAKSHDPQAVETLFEMYRPLLLKNAYINGIFDEDLWQEQCLQFLVVILRFSI